MHVPSLLQRKGKSAKLLHPWAGPYRVLEFTGPVNARIQYYKPTTKDVPQIVHVSRCKKFIMPQSGDINIPQLTVNWGNIEVSADDNTTTEAEEALLRQVEVEQCQNPKDAPNIDVTPVEINNQPKKLVKQRIPVVDKAITDDTALVKNSVTTTIAPLDDRPPVLEVLDYRERYNKQQYLVKRKGQPPAWESIDTLFNYLDKIEEYENKLLHQEHRRRR
jgi:hypothetical protein